MRSARESACFLLCLAICLFVILRFGVLQFGGWDGGDASNMAWQSSIGLRPYVDNITAVPPMQFIAGRAAFFLFGVHFRSLVFLNAIFSAATLGLHWVLLRRLGISLRWLALAAMLTQALTVMNIGWWYFNETTAVIGTLFVTAALALVLGKRDPLGWCSLTLLAAFLGLCKINIAGPLLLGVFTILIVVKATRIGALAGLGSAILLALLVLFACRIDPFAMLASYSHARGRLSTGRFVDLIVTWRDGDQYHSMVMRMAGECLLVCCICVYTLAMLNRDRLMASAPAALIGTTGLAAGILAMATNSDFKSVDIPVIAIPAIILLGVVGTRLSADFRSHLSMAMAGCCAVLLVICLDQAEARARILAIGPGVFMEPYISPVEDAPFFDGIAAGKNLKRAYRDVETLVKRLRESNPGEPRILFGPRLGWAYPAFSIRNCPGLPIWWAMPETGEMDNAAIASAVAAIKSNDFDACIFLRHGLPYEVEPSYRSIEDRTYMPDEAVDFIRGNFDVVETKTLVVYFARRHHGQLGVASLQP